MQKRYEKNIDEIFTLENQESLLQKHIAVIGAGGQGGYVLEFLARLGVASISFWEGDMYEEGNLNRQLGCLNSTLGLKKAHVLHERLKDINSEICYNVYDWYFGTQPEDKEKISSVDFIFYCADCYQNVETMRNILREVIISGVPMIDCPVTQLGGYVHIETKKDLDHFDFVTQNSIRQKHDALSKIIYANQSAYKCAIMAGEAVNQMVQYFSDCRYASKNATLHIDLYHHRYYQQDKFGEF